MDSASDVGKYPEEIGMMAIQPRQNLNRPYHHWPQMKQRQDIYRTMTAVRLEAGLTQAELAQLMPTTQSTIARLETGGRAPTPTTPEDLAEVTGQRLEAVS